MHAKISLVAITALFAGQVFAGAGSAGKNVSIINQDTAIGTARGPMMLVRNTTNSKEFIGCSVYAKDGVKSVYCSAMDRAGTYKTCYTSNPDLFAVATSITSAAEIVFLWDTSSGECTALQMTTGSYFLEKTTTTTTP